MVGTFAPLSPRGKLVQVNLTGGGDRMSLTPEPVPLASDADGVVRVGSTRVTLDTVVAAFREGMTPEGIVEQYPSLRLAQVYSVIAYVLNHPEEVEAYLRSRQRLADEVRRENEARFDPLGARDRLLARRRQG
jgi:uncharacterized protein (DUF433 family)